ncbi:MASE4 domain-containing protein [Bradyrhizobium sp. BR 10261]|uniref:MASE4 domain-containing protein n=1 Tax=Bradyrhizobium sp. BR 10261 TaxID=2749992 RepID=UPI001C64B0F8|nr:MASE4 domain-containing protein [Bradyrhizobium sp. BR 10261]MBW7965841.1 MASE4 domain-containing protein [Bradyrhizobium sp. BR 10261]
MENKAISREHSILAVADLPATPQQRRVVLILAVVQLVAFVVVAPLAEIPLRPFPAFIPSVQAVMFANDLITAVLLFAQYSITRSTALLILASGYVFTALIVIPQALTFPGAFATDGLLGAGPQSSTWLYIFWHIGSPAFMAAYGWIKDRDRPRAKEHGSAVPAIGWCVALVCILVCALTWVTTAGEQFLPAIFAPDRIHMIPVRAAIASAAELSVTVAAIAVLWMRRRSILDYWLILVLGGMVPDKILPIFFSISRWSLGYYAGRTFLLATSVYILVRLLGETTRLYDRLARANMQLLRQQENKLMTLQAALASISHEIKQPLSSARLNAEAAQAMLQVAKPDLEEVRPALNDMVVDVERANEILNNVRQLFGRAGAEKSPIDLNAAGRAVLQLLHEDLGHIQTTIELDGELPRIMANRVQLEEVIANLIRNAIQAMEAVEPTYRTLRLKTKSDGNGNAVLEIADTGPGIDPERLEQIFEAFVTTKVNGTGLGLAICRSIVENHKGTLTASSDGKRGASFRVILPVVN